METVVALLMFVNFEIKEQPYSTVDGNLPSREA